MASKCNNCGVEDLGIADGLPVLRDSQPNASSIRGRSVQKGGAYERVMENKTGPVDYEMTGTSIFPKRSL